MLIKRDSAASTSQETLRRVFPSDSSVFSASSESSVFRVFRVFGLQSLQVLQSSAERLNACSIMLRILLGLSALCLFAGAAPVLHEEPATIDITACPITYFGKEYKSLTVDFDSSSHLVACFDGTAATPVDCVKMPVVSTGSFSSDIITDVSSVSSGISTDFPHLSGSAVCAVKLTFTLNGASDFYFINYDKQAAAHVAVNVDPAATGGTFDFLLQSVNFGSASATSLGTYSKNVDLTGCRAGGEIYKNDEVISTDSATCTKTTCSSGLPDTASTCPAGQICLDNSVCATESFCSVIGPAVIDFSVNTGTIPDLCHYTLLKGSELTVTGVFGTRRLTDTPFLTEVIIKTTDTITLKQGGVVDVNPSGIETFSNPPVIHYGVTLTKDSTGVTAVYKDTSGIITKLFFDGTLLSITHTVPSTKTSYSEGVCASASGVSSNKDTALSLSGCDTVVQDPQGEGINCDAAKQRCTDKLSKVTCAKSPSAFITACAEFYCTYPDVDDLYCHFLDAYARSCKVDNWKTTAGCSASVCLNQACGSNEFCAVAPSGDSACYCQATFAAPFRANSSYGGNTVCSGKSASVTLVNCLLEEKGVNIESLHLKDPSCVGVVDPLTKKVTFSFSDTDTCDADISKNGDKVIYKNTIANTDGTVTRDDQVYVAFSCAYKQPDIQTLTLNIKDSSVVKVIDAGEWKYVFTLEAFTNAALTSVINPSTGLVLNEKLWLKLEVSGVDAGNLALVVDSCWATVEKEPTSTLTYSLIKNGCADEATVTVTSNGESLVSIFSFKVFQFVGHEYVYLHCDSHLCIKTEGCTKTCNP